MNWSGKNDRRLPKNAELRRQFDAERKQQTQDMLLAAELLTDENARRIERLRRMARVFSRGS